MNKLGFDLDGTLLNYNHTPGQMPKANWELIKTLQSQKITVITNQGGIPFSLANPKYPTASHFVDRILYLVGALQCFDVMLGSLLVCVYHPKASEEVGVKFVSVERFV